MLRGCAASATATMSRSLTNFVIAEGGSDLLKEIESLWHALRAHHAALSPTWRASIETATWPARRDALIAKSGGGVGGGGGGALLVLLAKHGGGGGGVGGDTIGYCVCTISASRQGEVDSLFVSPDFRGGGVGRALMRRAIRWFDEQGADPVVLDVLSDNPVAVSFYEQFGFASRTITMRRRRGDSMK